MPDQTQEITKAAVATFSTYLSETEYKNARLQNHLNAAVVSENFIVYSRDGRTANEIINKAEELRKTLSREWFGYEKANWSAPLVIGAIIEEKPCNGQTNYLKNPDGSTAFRGCIVHGSKERILDSVLPHELTHALFATHFNKIVPRWADEGASTIHESKSETNKHDAGLIKYLQESRGVTFADLFYSKEYPSDILPFYAQGYSVTKFLINLGDEIEKNENDSRRITGKQRFVEFLEQGMRTENWPEALNTFYGFQKIGDLKKAWNEQLANAVKKNEYVGNENFGKESIAQLIAPISQAVSENTYSTADSSRRNISLLPSNTRFISPQESSEMILPPKTTYK